MRPTHQQHTKRALPPALALVAALLGAPQPAPADAPPKYLETLFNSPSSGDQELLWGINQGGQVVGEENIYDLFGSLTDVFPVLSGSSLPFTLEGALYGINSAGQAVGQSRAGGGYTEGAFLYDPTYGYVPLTGGSVAYAINDYWEAAGALPGSTTGSNGLPVSYVHAAYWNNEPNPGLPAPAVNPAFDLGTLGGRNSAAYGIAPRKRDAPPVNPIVGTGTTGAIGPVVGAADLGTAAGAPTYFRHACLWSGSVGTDLSPTLTAANSVANGISAEGIVVGAYGTQLDEGFQNLFRSSSHVYDACVFTSAGPVTLPSLGGASQARAITGTGAGQIVGWSFLSADRLTALYGIAHAVIWLQTTPTGRGVFDLNNYIVGPRTIMDAAFGINAAGQIVGVAGSQGVLLTPDTHAPTTTAKVVGTSSDAGYIGPVQVSFSATDPDGDPSFTTKYAVDGAAYATYTAPITVSSPGTHTLHFYSIDLAGNTETAESQALTIAAPAADVTPQVQVKRGSLHLLIGTDRFTQLVSVTNIGGKAISGPVSLTLNNFGGNGSLLLNATGYGAVEPFNPYVTLSPGGLSPGATATVLLRFQNDEIVGSGVFNFTPRVQAGPGYRF